MLKKILKSMPNHNKIFGIIIIIITISLTICFANNYSDTQQLERTVRDLMDKIYNRDIDGIMAHIQNKGLIDADTTLTKNEVYLELLDPTSFYHNYFFKPFGEEELLSCNKITDKSTQVSYYAFIHAYGDDYDITIGESPSQSGIYSVKLEGRKRNPDECLLEVWYMLFIRINEDYFLMKVT